MLPVLSQVPVGAENHGRSKAEGMQDAGHHNGAALHRGYQPDLDQYTGCPYDLLFVENQ